jgi:checkpoint serine/threonine-protein kinase
MTFHSKAATNDVYDLFNQPLKCEAAKDDTQSGEESDFDDDGYSTAGESTGTGMISGVVSESGNADTNVSAHTTIIKEDNTGTSTGEVGGEWTEFSTSKHMPPRKEEACQESEDTNTSQAVDHTSLGMPVDETHPEEELNTPIEHFIELEGTKTNIRFVPIPPENYDPTPLRTFRDPSSAAQSRLPFMTPIIEKTESSLAATNPCQKDERDYFTSKTPSRSSPTNIDSPSKIGVERLLLSSPVAVDVSPQSEREVKPVTKSDGSISPSPKSKRPSRRVFEECEEDSFSPNKKVQITRVHDSPTRIKVKITTTSTSPASINRENGFVKPTLEEPKAAHSKSKERVITDLQCNPTDPSIRNQILATVHPPPASYSGLFNHPDETSGRHSQLQRYARKVQDSKIKCSPRKIINANDKTTTQAVPPILSFASASRVYVVKRELGQGAFAPVYLVDSYDPDRPGGDSEIPAHVHHGFGERGSLEAAKAEAPPSQAVWEFHIIHTIHDRLSASSASSRSTESIIVAHECHAFADEAYLILDYWPTGTLLDLVNLIKAENKRAGKAEGQGGLEEALAMFFSVELLRTVQGLHRIGILHGDLKGDNCLLRLPPASSSSPPGWLDPYARDGSGGWDRVGLKLIDFGRGIDVTNFPARVGFIADWAAGPTDAPEIREARPWVWQIDLCGAAGVVHSLLFGKYMETVQENKGTGGVLGGKKRYRIREGLKRYWQGQIWGQLLEALLNPILPTTTRAEEVEDTVLKELRRVQELMEDYLELEGERKGLRGAMRRVEGLVSKKK